jgi:hypothetical protein
MFWCMEIITSTMPRMHNIKYESACLKMFDNYPTYREYVCVCVRARACVRVRACSCVRAVKPQIYHPEYLSALTFYPISIIPPMLNTHILFISHYCCIILAINCPLSETVHLTQVIQKSFNL